MYRPLKFEIGERGPRKPLFWYMAGTITYVGDIDSPINVEREAKPGTEPNSYPRTRQRRNP